MEPKYDFFSIYWWVSVVLVGILINLGAAYLKPLLDGVLSFFSFKWRKRVETRKSLYQTELQAHLQDTVLVVVATSQWIINELRAVKMSVLVFFLAWTYSTSNSGTAARWFSFTFLIIALCAFTVLSVPMLASRNDKLFSDIRERRIEEAQQNPEG